MPEWLNKFTTYCSDRPACYVSAILVIIVVLLLIVCLILFVFNTVRGALASVEFYNCFRQGQQTDEYNDMISDMAYRSLRRKYVKEIKRRRAENMTTDLTATASDVYQSSGFSSAAKSSAASNNQKSEGSGKSSIPSMQKPTTDQKPSSGTNDTVDDGDPSSVLLPLDLQLRTLAGRARLEAEAPTPAAPPADPVRQAERAIQESRAEMPNDHRNNQPVNWVKRCTHCSKADTPAVDDLTPAERSIISRML